MHGDQRSSIDVKRLKKIRKRRDLSASQLSKIAGLERHLVGLIERGKREPKLADVQRIADVLRVPITAITLNDKGRPVWEVADWSQPERISLFLEEMQDSTSCISCVQDMDGYLVTDSMIEYCEHERLQSLGWDSERIQHRLNSMKAYVNEQRRVREKSRFVHRIIGRSGYFEKQFAAQPDIVVDVKRRLLDLDGRTLLGVLPRLSWQDFNETICRTIGHSCWDKVVVLDDVMAMVRPHRELFLFTYDKNVVDALKDVLERSTAQVPYEFPDKISYASTGFDNTVNHSIKALERIARRQAKEAPSGD